MANIRKQKPVWKLDLSELVVLAFKQNLANSPMKCTLIISWRNIMYEKSRLDNEPDVLCRVFPGL